MSRSVRSALRPQNIPYQWCSWVSPKNIATMVFPVGGNLEINTVTTFFEFGISPIIIIIIFTIDGNFQELL
ncbi:MAG: hypothetical protein MGG11_01585 [Trichodesmium sp. MAG_R03]|nr:hypothetical protein [Trichodesmium sp. MAG_R03]